MASPFRSLIRLIAFSGALAAGLSIAGVDPSPAAARGGSEAAAVVQVLECNALEVIEQTKPVDPDEAGR
jgi:hypothetical protein